MLCHFSNVIFLLITLVMIKVIDGCPESCICKWKGGKQTVECGGHQLRSIPLEIDTGTQVLNFSSNGLEVLQSERFNSMGLINLQKIYLSNNELIRIHDRAFRGLSNLVELDLSDNRLTTIPTETFQDYSSLMRLSLNGNPIRELKTSAFKYLSYLTTLELSNCQIASIEDEAFIGMDNLEWLRLDGNRIRAIRGSHILPESLHGINLQGNRWNCDCKLMDVHLWLNRYNIPQTEEPKCFEPEKFKGQTIKSLQSDDLACLPDITPTTIYLEITEGRNISLMCKITAVPEASISWWFQGQILQNDTIIAPNLHLYYYIEDEGADEKRSELFIFNANVDDNGTFACVAENSAGRAQANYTIRVIVKEEPIVEEVSFPQEIFFFIIGGTAFICLFLFICCCIIICKCRKRGQNSNKKKKRNNGKEVTFQLQNSQKCASIANDNNNPLVCSKLNGNLTITENNQQDMMLYITNNPAGIGISDNPLVQGQYCSPQDRNPDLVNDAESVKMRSRGDSEHNENDKENSGDNLGGAGSESSFPLMPILRPVPAARYNQINIPRGLGRDMYQVDVHLNPNCFVDQNGYPVEYSLAPLPIVSTQQQAPVNYYRTLPHNRASKLANNSVVRFSNEAEFITRTSQTFQTYAPDIPRYTAEGYPCTIDTSGNLIDEQNFPSPPEGYKTDGSNSLPTVTLLNNQSYCPNPNSLSFQSQSQQQPQWPSCLPGYHPQLVAIKTQNSHEQKRFPSPLQSPVQTSNNSIVTKKCVGAQTNDLDKNVIHEQQEEEEEEEEDSNRKCRQLTGPLADSPDEGYVGDSQESTDI